MSLTVPVSSNFTQYSALLCDVDQTLTTSHNQITDATRSALAQLQAQPGWVAAACTGRGYAMLAAENILNLFQPTTPHVCCGGALVITSEGEIIWHQGLQTDLAQPILELALQTGVGLVVKTARQMYGTPPALQHYQQVTTRYQSTLQPLDIDNQDWVSDPIMSLVAVAPTAEMMATLAELPVTIKPMNHYFGRQIVDITAQGVTKAEGVRAWCHHLKLEPSQVIGVGDSGNDLEFLNLVGYAVAMGNALPEIKAMANLEIPSNDQDGVAQFITSHLLGDTHDHPVT